MRAIPCCRSRTQRRPGVGSCPTARTGRAWRATTSCRTCWPRSLPGGPAWRTRPRQRTGPRGQTQPVASRIVQHVTSAAPATPLTGPAGRRSRLFGRRRAATVPWHVPYVLLAPAALALGAAVVFPFVYLVAISFQQFRARELIQDLPTHWVGLTNYRYILAKPEFWAVLGRTLIFAGVNVALTIAVGMGIALLLQRLGTRMRLLLSISMVLAWATPTVTATQVWQWLFDRDFGVVNWVLTSLRLGAFPQHSWLS